MGAITSAELNFLVFRYLQESGFVHSAFTLGYEAGIHKGGIDGNVVPPGALITVVQKGLQYIELEANTDENDQEVGKDFALLEPLEIITKDVEELQQIVKKRKRERLQIVCDKDKGKAKECIEEHEHRLGGERERERHDKEKDQEMEKDRTERDKVQEKEKEREKQNTEYIDKVIKHEEDPLASGGPKPMDVSTTPHEIFSVDVTVLEGHSSEVFACAWSPAGSLLASGSGDSTARIWTIPDGPCGSIQPSPASVHVLKHFKGRTNEKSKDVTTLDWNGEGTLLATGSYDGQARIWSRDGELKQTLFKHKGPIFSLKWNRKGDFLLSGSVDKTAIVWDTKTWECKQQFEFHSAPTLDVDWRNNNSFATCSTDNMIYVCKIGDPRPVKTFSGHQSEVNAIKWDPTGSLLASCSDDWTAKIWSVKQDKCVYDFKEHTKEIYTIRWSHNLGRKEGDRKASAAAAKMVKARMTTADVAAEVKCLRRLIGMRLSNVYDITPKTYLFKLMNSSGITESGESEKVLLLMESGVRLHTTQYVRDKSTTPSGFTLKLRKHVRGKRLEDVRMLGYDRMILFQFGLGSNAHFIILELYAQGNIILTDSEYTVMTLLRSHRDDNKGLAIMSRHRYPVEACRTFERTDFTKLKDTLKLSNTVDDKESSQVTPSSADAQQPSESANDGVPATDKLEEPANRTGKKSAAKIKQSGSDAKASNGTQSNRATLKTLIGEALPYGPALAEHIILDAGLLPSTKIGKDPETSLDDHTIQSLVESVTRFEDWLVNIISGQRIPEGYILMQNKMTAKKNVTSSEGSSINQKVYDEYCPILLTQCKSREYDEFETFDDALDEFYSKIESQRVNQQHKAKEDSAVHRLNKIKLDQENRVHTLRKEADHCITMAELIEYNLEDVDAAMKAVRVSLANGMSWEALSRMIKEEKKAGNPVAGLIDKLSFEKNCITLLLSNNLDDMDEEEKTAPVEKVEVDLSLSAHANARRWYEMKKKQETKQEKTIDAHEKAFKAAEKKTRLQLAQEKTVAAITHMRKVHWFEKFNWFISSENYLIVSGRDAQQNELVVKRYMSKGDLYVHAELHGASSTIIKNHKPDSPIPPLTLNQAGCFTVCHSKAWDSKIVTSAWWVYPHQVSKTAPTGEYLTVGSFMIRGKKNFLPPHPLIMGFGILFRLDESCLASHLNERRIRGEDEALPETEAEPRLNERRIRGEDEALPETEAELQKQQSNPEPDDKLATGSETSKGAHDNESRRDHTAVHQNDDTNHSNLPTNVDTANKSQQVAETKTVENSGTDASVSSRLEDLLDKSLGLGPAKGSSKSPLLISTLSSLGGDTDDLDVKKSMVREKPYVSKAERRKLKKGENACESTSDPQKVVKKPDNPQQEKGKDNTKAANPKTTRGQKGKLKKIKEKYAEQDEEEREIRMALLASSGKASQKDNPSQDGEDTTAKQPKPSTGEDISLKVCYKCKKSGHLSRDCPESTSAVDLTDVNGGRGRDGMDRSATPVDGSIAMDEDDIHELGDEEKEKLIDLDYLTGIPVASDILLYAVPVCAPYNALQTYKYRVKITPGTAKKGKAAKTAMSLFMHIPDATNREKELMKACTDPELVAAIIGNAKITAPGLTQLKQKQKQKGKKAAKNN